MFERPPPLSGLPRDRQAREAVAGLEVGRAESGEDGNKERPPFEGLRSLFLIRNH